jgi:hypothetical protein
MNCDKIRINNIETILKNNPESISNNDLIYYLKCNSNNQNLNDINLSVSEEYLKKINNSFFYENIFVNSSNYSSVILFIIGLLIPFYYFYPRFYKIGFFAYIVGFISLIGLYSKITNNYSYFFNKVGILYIFLTFSIYILFFILLNKLNHISLFFISAVLSYLLMNYILRAILSNPSNSNVYNKYRATMSNNTNYTPYNNLLETACYLTMSRYNLQLPSGTMLYTYLSEFTIGDNSNIHIDFITNLVGPFISVFILFSLGNFLSSIKKNGISIFPIIGLSEYSDKYISCQANYILPKELNVHLLINDIIEKYNFDPVTYSKVEKALHRISRELLSKYNPLFKTAENYSNKFISEHLKDNKIYIEIKKILNEMNNGSVLSNLSDINEVKRMIDEKDIPYKNKIKMVQLLDHIRNTLDVETNGGNNVNEDDIELAKDQLIHSIDINPLYSDKLKKIIDEYTENFKENLNLKENKLFGYYYNIISYSFLNDNIKKYFNKFFTMLITIFSAWILLAKPIGSPILISKYILSSYSSLFDTSMLERYFCMGLDKNFLIKKKDILSIQENSILKKGLNILYTVFIFILLAPIFYLYNSITFGFTLSPTWYNMLYQILFIINIIGNYICYQNNISYILFNIVFIIIFIIIFFIKNII